jgi:hypothetical protein
MLHNINISIYATLPLLICEQNIDYAIDRLMIKKQTIGPVALTRSHRRRQVFKSGEWGPEFLLSPLPPILSPPSSSLHGERYVLHSEPNFVVVESTDAR